jgi:hypothetical protein
MTLLVTSPGSMLRLVGYSFQGLKPEMGGELPPISPGIGLLQICRVHKQ